MIIAKNSAFMRVRGLYPMKTCAAGRTKAKPPEKYLRGLLIWNSFIFLSMGASYSQLLYRLPLLKFVPYVPAAV